MMWCILILNIGPMGHYGGHWMRAPNVYFCRNVPLKWLFLKFKLVGSKEGVRGSIMVIRSEIMWSVL